MKAWLAQQSEQLVEHWVDWWRAEDGVSYDRFFFTLMVLLLGIGFIMVTSASVPVAERLFGEPLHYSIRHLVYILIGVGFAYLALNVPIDRWLQGSMVLLVLGILGLIAVLAFGRNVNGSTRWLCWSYRDSGGGAC